MRIINKMTVGLFGLCLFACSSDMSNVPNMMVVSDYLASNYVFPHVKNLKYLVVSLDIDLWHKDEQSEYNFFYMDYKKHPGYVYDENHDFWKNGYPEGLAELTQISLGLEYYATHLLSTMGYDYSTPGDWEDEPSVDFDTSAQFIGSPFVGGGVSSEIGLP